jgi:MOSC domain-containing protein YiiM
MAVAMPRLASIQVGRPQQHGDPRSRDPMERLWTSAFYKTPVEGSVYVRRRNIDGDGQADLEVHGGPDKAICVYAADHYAFWQEELKLADMPPGAFGENFTVSGLVESDVCIGDVWRVGDAVVVQISQPRQPCWKLARRWQIKTLTARVIETGKTGWYFRVLTEGAVAAGAELVLAERPHASWTIAAANRVMYDRTDRAGATVLGAVEELSESWRAELLNRVRKAER